MVLSARGPGWGLLLLALSQCSLFVWGGVRGGEAHGGLTWSQHQEAEWRLLCLEGPPMKALDSPPQPQEYPGGPSCEMGQLLPVFMSPPFSCLAGPREACNQLRRSLWDLSGGVRTAIPP